MFSWPVTIAYTLQRISGSTTISNLSSSEGILGPDDSLYITVVGARQEATLPHRVWQELSYLATGVNITLHHVGPEVPSSLDGKCVEVSAMMRLKFDSVNFEDLPADSPQPDMFVLFNSGVGFQHSQGSSEWEGVLEAALSTQKPMLFTSFSIEDATRDQAYLEKIGSARPGGYEVLIPVEENPFMNMKKDAARNNYRYMIHSNHSIQVIRGT